MRAGLGRVGGSLTVGDDLQLGQASLTEVPRQEVGGLSGAFPPCWAQASKSQASHVCGLIFHRFSVATIENCIMAKWPDHSDPLPKSFLRPKVELRINRLAVVVQRDPQFLHEQRQTRPMVFQTLEHFAAGRAKRRLPQFAVSLLGHRGDMLTQRGLRQEELRCSNFAAQAFAISTIEFRDAAERGNACGEGTFSK